MRDDLLLALGTSKGLFLLDAEGLRGPMFPGDRVPSLLLDDRGGTLRMYAGAVSEHWGPGVRTSDDMGNTWTAPEVRSLRFPHDTDTALVQVWQLAGGGDDRPDTLYAGVEPAALFRSDDRGETWDLDRALWNAPAKERWEPGFGGLGLHTVLVDPTDSDRLTIAISAGGVYRTDDGGTSWRPAAHGIRSGGGPEEYPVAGQCVHKVVRDAANPDRLYARNHWGVFRSDDHADSWQEITDAVGWDFGFSMISHPHRAGTVLLIPLDSDNYRCSPDGACVVARTIDGGETWQAARAGLPQHDAHLTVLRDAMCHDGGEPLGVYFGTRQGQAFASSDEGESWELLVENLPSVLCIRAMRLA